VRDGDAAMTSPNPLKKVRTARTLRRNETDYEYRLWQALRNRATGFKFRRQHPIGPYVADFACPEAKLVIEIDGPWHEKRVAQDAKRTEELKKFGYEVLRIALKEDGSLEAFVELIRFTVKERIRDLHGRK
jgi:very-short-patch-repair endonuclease